MEKGTIEYTISINLIGKTSFRIRESVMYCLQGLFMEHVIKKVESTEAIEMKICHRLIENISSMNSEFEMKFKKV
jgi:hypothetical protein